MKDKFSNFFKMNDEYEYVEEYETDSEHDREMLPPSSQKKNIVNLSTVQQPSGKVELCEPKSYDEVQDVTDHLLNRRTIIVNLQRLETQEAMRIVDFLSGTVYAIKGDIQKIGKAIFICTPDNVDLSGQISQHDKSEEYFDKGW